MNENKYDYLKQQWEDFKIDIDLDEKSNIDKCFSKYVEKISTKDDKSKLRLEEYTNRKSDDSSDCDYFCTFIENKSSKFYGSASAGSAKYFGIKKNDDKDTYYISKLVHGKQEQSNAKNDEAQDKFINILNNLEVITRSLNDSTKNEIFKYVEIENKISSKVMLRKIVAMNNHGSFLYAYSDEAIDRIYNFFVNGKHNTNIEKNFEVTKILKNLFSNKMNEDDNIYLIRLSRFIWSVFGSSISLESKNMILHGAPGTGKTYSVKNTVKNIILNQGGNIDKQLVFTQFHPSYSYEDFIDGIKPNGIDENNGQLKFELKNGNFKELCKTAAEKLKEERKAKKSDDDLTKFFFIADEINRAELSRVFGELLICLEDDYRLDYDNQGNILKEESLITLQNASLDTSPIYEKNDKKYFGVPTNLYFIGTMNDIDRSVDSFDMALRRRFYWKEIRCNYDFILEKTNPEVKNICRNLNRYITGYKEEKKSGKIEKVDKVSGKEPLRLGTSFELGHAYFKDIGSIDKKSLNNLWEAKIEPLLKEYLRAEYSQDEIYTKLEEAKEIFSLPKKDNDDTDS